jgi:hypothetical protein
MKLVYKDIYKKRRIKGLNTKDFQGDLEIIFIKRRFHLFLIEMKEQGHPIYNISKYNLELFL